jgi:7,8-dihydropterin-6-yl-methyl-4-(beta-D-ribofuranosyl)aminobenzene 5'-phosphate synthase
LGGTPGSATEHGFPDIPVYGLAGGLHMVFPNEDLIQPTVRALREFPLGAILAGHCTGWRALHALVDAFGEEVVTPLAVGSRYRL